MTKACFETVFTEEDAEGDVELTGVRNLSLVLKQGDINNENRNHVRTLVDMVSFGNIDMGCGIRKIYKGVRVTIRGKTYENVIPASMSDHDKEGREADAVIR